MFAPLKHTRRYHECVSLQEYFWLFFPTICVAPVTAVMVIRDPRRMRCAVFLGATLATFAISLFALAAGSVKDQVATYFLLGFIALGALLVVVLGIFLVVSGVMLVRREGMSLSHSLSLALGVAVLAYPVAIAVTVITEQQRLLMFLTLLVFPLTYLAFVVVSYVIYSGLYGFIVKRFFRSYSTIVVLGAGLIGGELTPLLRARVDLGIDRYQKKPGALLVFSGGQGPDETTSEAFAMATYAHSQGVPSDSIAEENSSRTTSQNIAYSYAALKERPGRWVAVTSDFHAFRAAMYMRQKGMPGQAIGAKTRRYFWSSAVLREVVAVVRENLWLNIIVLLAACIPLMVALWVALAKV